MPAVQGDMGPLGAVGVISRHGPGPERRKEAWLTGALVRKGLGTAATVNHTEEGTQAEGDA